MRRALYPAIAALLALILAGCGAAPAKEKAKSKSPPPARTEVAASCPGAPAGPTTQPGVASAGTQVINIIWNAQTGCILAKVSTDGGNTFTPHLVAKDATSGDGIANAQIQLLNYQTGWVMVEGTPGAGQAPWVLFRTKDGGKTWTKLAATSPAATFPTGNVRLTWKFTSATAGSIVDVNANDSPLKVFVYQTADGGRTWSEASFALPAGASGEAVPTTPIYSSATNGSLEVTLDNLQTGASVTYLYTTKDGGKTWTLATSLSGQS